MLGEACAAPASPDASAALAAALAVAGALAAAASARCAAARQRAASAPDGAAEVEREAQRGAAAAAATARALLRGEHAAQVALELVRRDALVPLLCAVQSGAAAGTAAGPPDLLRWSDECALLLGELAELPLAAGDARWEALALASLALVDPFFADGALRWPVRVVSHEGGWSVLDVIETAADGAMLTMRQLVRGPWRGVNEFRESEVDASAPPGAGLENFYATTLAALAAFHAAGQPGVAAAAQPRKVLLIGLGGGSIASFLLRYCGSSRVAVTAVEISAEAARASERYFGVPLRPSQLAREEAVPPQDLLGAAPPLPNLSELGLGGAQQEQPEQQRRRQQRQRQQQRRKRARTGRDADATASGNGAAPPEAPLEGLVDVYIDDALAFLRRPDAAAAFDFVIVDVYTAGAFPAPLLVPEFFEGLRRALRPGGAVAVNAGYGECERRARELLHAALAPAGGHVVRIVDRDAVAEADREFESTVLLGDTSALELSPADWLRRDALHALPFLLAGWDQAPATPGHVPLVRAFWRVNDRAAPGGAPPPTIIFASKDDAVFDLFA
jgi:SAM-dependent methyltransferase